MIILLIIILILFIILGWNENTMTENEKWEDGWMIEIKIVLEYLEWL